MPEDWELYEEEFEAEEQPRPKKKGGRKRGSDSGPLAPIPEGAIEERLEGRVASITRLDVTIVAGDQVIETPPAREADGTALRLAIGDEVVLARRGEGWKIEQVRPRRTRLSRPDPHDPDEERTFAANVDTAILVLSLRQPPLRIGLADRFIVACQRGGVLPAIVINKIDLVPPEELEEIDEIEHYIRMNIPVIPASAKSGAGLPELSSLIRGKVSVLVGHSGVGKSTMLNTLLEASGGTVDHTIRTGEVNRKVGAGRHTTTASTLYDLGDGTWIIDTPGVRQFGLWDLDAATLAISFPEFESFASGCRFSDCTHSHEPDCGVREAVDEGELDEARFETYLRLLEEV